MHTQDLSAWTHSHTFDGGNRDAERGTRLVMVITAIMMVVEIAAGLWFNSMALLADGWHMSSHALAIGLSAFAYAAARRYASDRRFAFGAWKIEVLAAFASAVFLLCIAALMATGSVERLFSPQEIHYREALVVTALGLLVNLGCALILGGHAHGHGHGHAHGHGHHHHDHDHHHGHHDINLRAAYVHVLADAATSVLAIVALAGGWWLGWAWLDPVMGLVGAALVGKWAIGLLRQSGTVLLDREMDHPVVEEVREVLAGLDHDGRPGEEGIRVTDLHVWRVGRQHFACIVCLVTHDATLTPQRVRQALSVHEELVHVTIEISHCDGTH